MKDKDVHMSKLLWKMHLVMARAKAVENAGAEGSVRSAQEAIDTVAEWFEEVLDVMGVIPSTIPSLLHWQAHAHEYCSFSTGTGNDEMDDDSL